MQSSGHLASALSLDSFLPVSHNGYLISAVLDFFRLLECVKMISTCFIPFHMLLIWAGMIIHTPPHHLTILTDDGGGGGRGEKSEMMIKVTKNKRTVTDYWIKQLFPCLEIAWQSMTQNYRCYVSPHSKKESECSSVFNGPITTNPTPHTNPLLHV